MQKRIFSALLAITLLFTSVNIPDIQLNAEEQQAQQEELQEVSEPTPEATPDMASAPTVEPTPEPTSEITSEPTTEPTSEPTSEPTPGQGSSLLSLFFAEPAALSDDTAEIVTMYGNNGDGNINLAVEEDARFDYGTKIVLSLDGVSDSVVFLIKSETEEEDDNYDSDTVYEPGSYRLGFSYDPGEGSVIADRSFENYGFTIVAAELAVPSNLRWEGTKATWDALKTDVNGNNLKDGCDYKVSLYRDGNKVTEESVTGSGEDSQSADFKEYIDSEAGGKGSYTFSVQAVVPESLTGYYTDSDESPQNESGLYAVEFSMEKEEGISEVSSGSETSFLLIAAENCNSREISATVAENWSFDTWSIKDQSDDSDGISFTSPTNNVTDISIDTDYSGDTDVTIIAGAKESNKPEISSYSSGSGDDKGKLVATALDNQSGLQAYAFSKADSSETISAEEWNELDNITKEARTFAFEPASSGKYYFYAKDADGNIGESSEAIPVTVITYDGYYEDDVKIEKEDYYIGSDSFALPDLTDSAGTVHRRGYNFEGWYTTADKSGDAVTEFSVNTAEDVICYAEWTLTVGELDWKTELSSKTITYTGENIELTAKVNDTTADVTYTWYKKDSDAAEFQEIESQNTTGTFTVRNVNDSGEYRVDAVITYKDDSGMEQTRNLSGTPVTITIEQAALTVQADNKTVTYGDEAPVYTVTYTGLVGEDQTDITKALITEGSLLCTYQKDSPCIDGGYHISFREDAPFSSVNYSITTVPGKLTVEPKNVNAVGTTVTATLDDSVTYEYTGEPVIPSIIVRDGEKSIDAGNYGISYDNNISTSDHTAPVSAGEHTATITFKGNYTGEVTIPFTISKMSNYTPEITMENWDYDGTAKSPSYSNVPYQDPEVTYYYLDGTVTDISDASGSTEQPVNAGTYTVYAIFRDSAGNYEDQTSSPVTYTINRRVIRLVAGSEEWEYDGNPHSYNSYTIEDKNGNVITQEQAFILPTESFQSIKVTGSVTDVNLDENGNNIGETNSVSYTLTSATNAGNYDIRCVPGTLKVTPTSLPYPANLKWDDDNPGTATWVAISRADLVVEYEVRLYMHDAANEEAEDEVIATETTPDTFIDFASEIHNKISANSQKSFYFSVKAIVSGSTDTAGKVKNDYEDSRESDYSPSIYTATISLTKKLCDDETEDQAGLESIEFTGDYAAYNSGNAVTLIAGESFTAKAVPANGYEFASYQVCSNNNEHWHLGRWHTTNPELNEYFSSKIGDDGEVTITVNPGLTQSLSNVFMTASVRDESPTYKDFKAENKSDYSAVTMSIQVMDQLGIKRWCLVKVEERTGTYTDGSKYTYYEPLEYGDWQSFQRADNTYPAGEYVTASVEITEPGTYQIAYSDAETGESRVYYPSGAFTVYEIKFEKGETDDNINTMSPIYKLANTEIILPLCTFTKTGYSFQNWSGVNTGISVDGAVFKANTNDILTANWTNDQYTYKVEYYYMNTDGTYNEEPSETATFTGKYGDVIVASATGEGESAETATEAIQKPKKNYTNDANPGVTGYQNSITLTEDNQTLRIYYKIGSYTITYKYTIPGEADETVVPIEYNFGAAIEELSKPEKAGYDFVGWVYEGYGSVPETMPAKNLTATGSFVAKSAKYNVVYHLETIGSGTTHTDEYEISADLTQIYNSKQGEQIKAYLSKGSDLTTNELAGIDIDGFTLKGVFVTYGAASNSGASDIDTLPAESIRADGEKQYAEGTVNADESQTLYINYYYTRNVYNLILEVWKDSREVEGNKIYSESKQYQYGEGIQELVEKYKSDSYYIDENGSSILTGFTMPTGYKFATYTDFSTGNAPTTMPAGNVTVTRDVVAADKVKYYVEVYFEKSAIDSFDLMTRLTYEATEGTMIKIGKTGDEQEQGYTYIYYDEFVKTLNNYNYYTHIVHDSAEYKSKESGEVVADETDPLVLRVYFERIKTTATINYFYGNSHTNSNRQFASITLEGKWGDKYVVDPIALFDEVTNSDWVEGNSVYQSQNAIIKSHTEVSDIEDSSGNSQSGLAYNFRSNSYLISYQSFYRYFNSSDVVTWEYPSHTFTTVSSSPQEYDTGYGSANANTDNAGLGDTIICYFGATTSNHDARCNVYYNQIVADEDFYLDVRLKYSNLNDKTDTDSNGVPDWYEGTEKNGNKAETVDYEDDATTMYIPITYQYDGQYYQLRIMNKCAIVNGTLVPAEGATDDYPAANAKNRKYTYTAADTLKSGFIRISGTDEYYFYDPNTADEATKAALGSEPCVFLADSSDRFMQGAYVSYGLGSGTSAYEQAKAVLDSYIEKHADTASPSTPDESAAALAFNNTSYGSTYVYGTHGYLTYSFYYRDKCQLTFYYNGNTCSHADHLYVYGTTVLKDKVTCSHIATIPVGYELVWYTDSSFTNPIPDDGLYMNVSRTVYGRMEKSTIKNMEYIYYELADPITLEETTYKYVTQDNIDEIRGAGKTIAEESVSKVVEIDNGLGGTVSKEYKITTYTYDGAVVMVAIERPTVSYTELYLTKDTEAYTDYYGKDYEEAYGKTGFYYDETNTDNRSYGYVNTSSLNLKVYFARDKYQVEVITNVSDDSNPEFYTFSIDQKVQLGEPVKAGYTFAGWSWKKVTAEGLVDYAPSLEQGEQYFNMPGFNLQATANWTPAEFDQTVVHYFQTANQVYESGFISGISGTSGVTIQNVNFNGITGSADVYRDEDNAITAVVLTADNGEKYYFSSGTLNEENSLSLRETDLVAAETKIKVKSDESTASDKGALTGLSMYSYTYTSYRSGTQVVTLKDSAVYTPVFGMKLEYYYIRSANFRVRLAGVSTDGGETGLSFNGAGEHVYGETVNLVAVLAAGYDFLGWYEASDIFSDYPGDVAKENLSEYSVKENLATVLEGFSPVSNQKTYNLSVNEDLDLVAVVKPQDTVAPTLEITGNTEYIYGYEESAGNALMAIATKGEGADKTTVTGYQWYEITLDADENEIETPMEGQTSSTLLIETGKNAGTYRYRCVVSYKNSENGREGTISANRVITVKKANMTVSTKGYEGVFDNQEHSITLSVIKPYSTEGYTVYYDKEVELTAENYSTQGTEESLPAYIHVNSNESGACAHTTYFYIKDNTGNYNDYIGSETVNITPKTISIKAKNATFSKLYDGNKKVVGAPTDEGTDMYKFAHGNGEYYELSGFVDGDSEVSSYILACDAEFNDYHVTTAKSFTISGLKLVNNADGVTEYDYSFPSATSLTFAGMIKPRPLNVEWENKEEFVYNGEPQAPDVKLSGTQTYPIPEADKDYIELTVTGKQTNVGEYTAYASAGVKSGGTFYSSDYTFDTLSKDYKIIKRSITIKPVDGTITYDGNAHTIDAYEIYYGEAIDTVVSVYNTSADSKVSYINAGSYPDMCFKNLVISDRTGKILTDNYDIAYKYGTLTIKPAPVMVSGITAKEKNYDGTESVEINIDSVVFKPIDMQGNIIQDFLYSQNGVMDELNLDISKIQAAYEDSEAGITKTVNLTIPADALTGTSKDNYVLIPEKSQTTATGKINSSVIKLKADPATVVYGENPDFTYSYSGIIKADGTSGTWDDITVTGTEKYLINAGTENEPDWKEYSAGTTPAGVYEIKIDVNDLETDNYTFKWEEDTNAVLTVKPRPVSLNAVTGEAATIKKTYDGTINVETEPGKGIHYSFGKITDEQGEVFASGVLEKDKASFDLNSKSYEYNSKDVTKEGTETTVILTNAVINNPNYSLVNTSCNIPGKIEPKSLTIKAVDKIIEYGTVDPGYEATYDGFVTVDDETETAAVLSGSLTFTASTYDAGVPGKRHVGTYDIVPGGFGDEGTVNGNYKIHYEKGTLTVEAVTVYLKADNKTLRYKVGNVDDAETGRIPQYSYTGPAWKYEGDEDRYNPSGVNLPRTETGLVGDKDITLLTVPGTYPIKICTDSEGNVTGITKISEDDAYDDYIFKAIDGKLTISRYLLTITGTLGLGDKIYDGTLKIENPPTTDDIKNLFVGKVATEDEKYIGVNEEDLKNYSQYASKDVGTNIEVNFKIELNEELAKRYELDIENTKVTATSSILPRPIEVKAKDKEIAYGSSIPDNYGIEPVPVTEPVSETNMGLVSGEALTEEYTFSGPTGYACDYQASAGSFSPVGSYQVTPEGVTATNYSVTCKNTGVLTVTQATLKTPVPVWDEETPGNVKWEAVNSIGDVTVAGYRVELFKAGQETAVTTIDQTTALNQNFADVIRANGGGQYTVKVTAIASTNKNEEKKNVKDSEAGTTVEALYATEITPVFGGEASGKGELITGNDPVYVNNAKSYVVIAGESNIPIKGVLKNATGYTVEATADTGLTLSTDGGIVTDGTEVSYRINVSVAKAATPAPETKVTLKLTARKATLKATFTVDKTEETYGFSENAAPKFTASVEPVDDNIGVDDYTYSYQWKFKPSSSNVYSDMQTSDLGEYCFPNRYDSYEYTPYGTNYRVKCLVTATRKDNGQYITAEASSISGDKYIVISIKKGSYQPGLSFGVGKEKWVYGESRNYPEVTGTVGEVTPEKIHLKYSVTGEANTWGNEMFTDVGIYYVRAQIDSTANYDAVVTEPISYEITRAKLQTPENVQMSASDTAPYGKITWNAVEGPRENAGKADECDSSIKVKYKLTLEYTPVGATEKQQLGEAVVTSATSCDFTDRIIEAGTYYVTVQAIVDEQRGGQDVSNCDDSDPVAKDAFITIGADVTSNIDGNAFSKVYDGNPLTLTVSYSDASGTPTYQWMKDGQELSGATEDHISITYVEESASFVCKVTSANGNDVVYTRAIAASITPRPITVTTGSNSKTYDGNALTDRNYTITSPLGLAENDTITEKTMSASQTNAGSADNTISGIVIKRRIGETEKVVYSENGENNNYVITVEKGKLTVSKRPVSLTWTEPEDMTYDGQSKTVTATIDNKCGSDEVSVSSYTDNEKTKSGSYTAMAVTLGGEAASNYTLEGAGNVSHDYTIARRNLEIEILGDSKVYDGLPLTKHGYSLKNETAPADGETIAVTYTGTRTDAGSSDNTVSEIKVMRGSEDTTEEYVITTTFGKLTVTQRPLEITAENASKVYDGTALTKDSYKHTGGTLAGEDRIASVTVTGTQTNYGVAENIPKDAVIKNGEKDVTANYKISYAKGTLTVEKRAVTITAQNMESCYGETPVSLTCTIGNPAGAGQMTDDAVKEELRITLSCDVTSTTSVGPYPITVNYDTQNQNYAVTTIPGTYTVTAAEIVITARDESIEYDTGAHSPVFTVSKPVSDGVVRYYSTSNLTKEEWEAEIARLTAGNSSQTVTTTLPSYTDVGTYTVYCYGTKDNYISGKASATVTITEKPVSSEYITVEALPDVTYRGSAYTPDLTVKYGNTPLVKGRDYTVSYENNTNAGTATVTITGTGNYTGSRNDISFTINPKPVSLTWTEPEDMTYDGQSKTVTATIDNRCGSDEVSVSSYTDNEKTKSGSYTAEAVTLGGGAASNYTLEGAGNVSHDYTIARRNLEIEILGDSKVYDGLPLTKHGYSLKNETAPADGETIAVTYTGTRTDAGSSDNTVSEIKVMRGAEDTTEEYVITTTFGKLTVTQRPLEPGDLTIDQNIWEFTGEEIHPEYTVKKELRDDTQAVVLTKDTDYTVTRGSNAAKVGTYILEVEGKGNYSGKISVSYSIVDNTKAVITGITEGGKYCISKTVEITDKNLAEVVIKKGSTEIASFSTFANGKLIYTIDGRDADAAGSEYTVYVRDLASKDAAGVEVSHEQTYHITLYPDHGYDADQSGYNWDSSRLTGTQECRNTGDAEDTIINRWGTVVWNYAYSYDTPEGVQSGIQGVEARATYAKVELLQNGTVIATQYVNCDSDCGVGSAAAASGTARYRFTTYDPANPGEASGAARIPLKDENGNEYTYSLNFTPGKMTGGTFVPVNEYVYMDSEDYGSPYNSCGYQRTYSYSPQFFNVPWEVTLKNLPQDEDGNLIYPSRIYVKVLYAFSGDAEEEEYQIISQQTSEDSFGVPCEASVNGDTVVYTGSYPVWKYIGDTTDSYYHRIQIVGYDLKGTHVDVSTSDLKSVNDSDHVNHTICYVSDTDSASGIIRYELGNLLPTLIFDKNDGSQSAYAVINSVAGGTVSYSEIQKVKDPVRSGYKFLGWYTDSVEGTKIETDVRVGTLGVTVYAHWEKVAALPEEPGEDVRESETENIQESIQESVQESTDTVPAVTPITEIPETEPAASAVPESIPEEKKKEEGVDKTTVPSASEEKLIQESETEKDRNLLVYVVNENELDGEGKAVLQSSDRQEQDSKGSESIAYLTAELPDTGAVADAVLTEDEWKIYNDGGSIVIRLVINDSKEQKVDESLQSFMDKLLAEELKKAVDRESGKTIQFKSYIDLRLEKKINDVDWKRMQRTNDPIEVVINLPADMIREGETLYLAKKDGNSYILIEDLDKAPETMTIMTADFESEYVLVSIQDEATPLQAYILEGNCRWHYIIFIVTIIYFLTLLITMKRKKEEDDSKESEVSENAEDEEDDGKKRKRNSAIRRSLSQAVLLLIYIWVNIQGFCRIELPASIIGMLLITIEQILTYRHKFKEKDDSSENA